MFLSPLFFFKSADMLTPIMSEILYSYDAAPQIPGTYSNSHATVLSWRLVAKIKYNTRCLKIIFTERA